MHDAQEHEQFVAKKRRKRMAMVDSYPPAVRELVHEYGLAPVKALLDVGVKKPNQIRHVIETVLDNFSPTRGTFSQQGPRRELAQVNSDPSNKTDFQKGGDR